MRASSLRCSTAAGRRPLAPRTPLRPLRATPPGAAPQPPPAGDESSIVGGGGGTGGWPVGVKTEPIGPPTGAAARPGTSLATTPAARAAGAAPPPPALAPSTPAAPLPATSTPWDDWQAHFAATDAMAELAAEAAAARDDAAAVEDYAAAAAAHATAVGLASRDAVRAVGSALHRALATEDYASAAALRDAGGAGLVGWWAAGPTPADPAGHLLRIAPEYGRYAGLLFRASDVAEAAGWGDFGLDAGASSSDDDGGDDGRRPAQQPQRRLGGSPPASAMTAAFEEAGHPVLEWYVRDRRVKEAGGEARRPPASPAAAADEEPAALVAHLESTAAVLPAAAAFHISIENELDDEDEDREDEVDGDDEELGARGRGETRGRRRRWGGRGRSGGRTGGAEASSAPGAEDAEGDASDGFAPDSDGEDDEASTAGRRHRRRRRPADRLVMFSVAGDDASLDDDETDSEGDDEPHGRDPADTDGGSAASASTSADDARQAALAAVADALLAGSGVDPETGGWVSVPRARAALAWHSPDKFTLAVEGASAGAAAGAVTASDEFTVVASAAALARARPTAEDGDPSTPAVSRLSFASSDEDVSDDDEDDDDDDGTASLTALSDAVDAVSEEEEDALVRAAADVARAAVRASRAALDASPGASPAEVAGAVRETVAGALGPGARVTADAVASSPCLTGSTTYERLDPAALTRPADPYTGIYLAAFGGVGPELVLVRRETAEERASSASSSASPSSGHAWPASADTVVGVRLASDAGGRARGVVFRAAVGRDGRLPSAEAYPPELGVRGRYKAVGYLSRTDPGAAWGAGFEDDDEDEDGLGRATSGRGGRARRSRAGRLGALAFSAASRRASRGFGPVGERAVEGELLEFSGRAPVTRGAGLGFVWAGPGDRRHLVLLTRVPLDDPAAVLRSGGGGAA